MLFDPARVKPDAFVLAISKLATGAVTVPLFVNVCALLEIKIKRVLLAVELIVAPTLLVTFPPILSHVAVAVVPAEITSVELLTKFSATATVAEVAMVLVPAPDKPRFPL